MRGEAAANALSALSCKIPALRPRRERGNRGASRVGSTGPVLGSFPLIYCAHPSPILWVLSSSQGRALGVVRRAPPRCPLGAVAPQNAVSLMRCRSHLLPFQPDLEVLSWGNQEKQEKIRRIGRKPGESGENWENQAKIRRNQLCAVGRRRGSSCPHPSLPPLLMEWLPAREVRMRRC